MTQDSSPNSTYRFSILVIAVVLVPVAFLGLRALYGRIRAATTTPVVAMVRPVVAPRPHCDVALRKIADGVEARVTFVNPTSIPATGVTFGKLNVGGVTVLKASENWGTVAPGARTSRTYIVKGAFGDKTSLRFHCTVEFHVGPGHPWFESLNQLAVVRPK